MFYDGPRAFLSYLVTEDGFCHVVMSGHRLLHVVGTLTVKLCRPAAAALEHGTNQ